MDFFSLTGSPLCPHSSAIVRHHYSVTSTSSTTKSLSFSLKPPPPSPPQPPTPESNTSSATNIRRPRKPLKSSPPPFSKPKISSNPLRILTNPSYTSSPLVTTTNTNATADSLSSKLWLTSRLAPPPPPPPLPPPTPPTSVKDEFHEDQTEEIENENPVPEFRQEGKIFVGNLPNWIKKNEVIEYFRQFGPIKNVILIRHQKDIERNAGFGFVIFEGPMAGNSAIEAEKFDGVEFHGRVLTVKLDDGRRLKEKGEERARWLEGYDEKEYRSKWHQDRDGCRKTFKRVIETEPDNWQAVVQAFERIEKVND